MRKTQRKQRAKKEKAQQIAIKASIITTTKEEMDRRREKERERERRERETTAN